MKPPKAEKVWVAELELNQSDREIILSPTAWITDTIVNAAQELLKQQCPFVSGFQKVTCGFTMNFDIETGEFIQILHTGQGHWMTVTTIGTKHPEVLVFDSLYACAPTLAKAQIASLLATQHPVITLKFVDVQMQSGTYDCGLFAIAHATALALGEQPGNYLYDQPKMRKHLYKSFQMKTMTLFPLKKERRNKELKVKTEEEILVYCHCRMPELPNTRWVQCSHCENWFHIDSCISVPPEALQPKNNWFCNSCT